MESPRAFESLDGFEWLNGQRCTRILRRPDTGFVFEFGPYRVCVLCAWRIVRGNGELLLGLADYEQLFASRSALDAQEIVATLMMNAHVMSVTVAEPASDLAIGFAGGHVLEVWNDSASGEAWRLVGPGGRTWTAAAGTLISSALSVPV
ncbi:MAG: hypothetical protein ABI794_08450 [Betaproteobacteria bacterium]